MSRMRMLGAEVVPVEHGSATSQDAINEALRDWVTNVGTTHYLISTVTGPHPFPEMVRDFHRIIRSRGPGPGAPGGRPTARCRDRLRGWWLQRHGHLPPFIDDEGCPIGIEAGGEGIGVRPPRGALRLGRPGVLHGAMSYLMRDADGQTVESHSISAGPTTRASGRGTCSCGLGAR